MSRAEIWYLEMYAYVCLTYGFHRYKNMSEYVTHIFQQHNSCIPTSQVYIYSSAYVEKNMFSASSLHI